MRKLLLTMNLQKTKFITFALTQASCSNLKKFIIVHDRDHCTDGCDWESFIEVTDTIKYLGIHVDRLLRWKDHVMYLLKIIRSSIPKFKLLVNILPRKILFTVYYALVQSVLEYGIVGWGAAYRSHLVNLEILQKFILKIIMKKDRLYSTELLFSEARVFTLKQLFYKNALMTIFKNERRLDGYEHSYSTRSQMRVQLQVPRSHKTFAQMHAHCVGIRLYNTLPEEKRRANSLKYFTKNIRSFIFSL